MVGLEFDVICIIDIILLACIRATVIKRV